MDVAVMLATLGAFVAYGLWRSRGTGNLQSYLVAGRGMPWPMVALSVMATQASAITFLSTPGQGYADGLRFVQFYLGLPLAMVVLCITAVPIYHRLRVFTAYEYLQGRFDGKTRSLAAALFLIQRGLAAGLTIYAPALVLSVMLGWEVRWTCVLLGGLVVLYTAAGGSKAVSHTHLLQFSIIMGTMVLAFALVLRHLPRGMSPADALHVAGRLGKLEAVNFSLDLDNRYSFWSGLIGGFFLQLSYFGTDQSQVGRYLTGRSVGQSRQGLLFNGLVKVPMQFFILLLGVMVFVSDLFVPTPAFFNPAEVRKVEAGPWAADYHAAAARHGEAIGARRERAEDFTRARRAGDAAGAAAAAAALRRADAEVRAARGGAVAAIRRTDPGANPSDTNYIFLSFVLRQLPMGVVGLVLAAIFAASMNSVSAELNALTSTTIVDVWRRLPGGHGSEKHQVAVSRVATVVWAAFAVGFAEYASRLGSLIEAVNILGSLFYGTILGIFLTAFTLKRVGGTAVFIAALVAEAAVVACFKFSAISFLWYNLIGCAVVMLVALALSPFFPANKTAGATETAPAV